MVDVGALRRHETDIGVSFVIPPSWRVEPCDGCLTVDLRIVGREPYAVSEGSGVPIEIGRVMGSPEDEIERTREYVRSTCRSDFPEAECSFKVKRSAARFGGMLFHSVSFGSLGYGHVGTVFHVGQVDGSTYVLEFRFGFLDDPSLRLIAESIRFD